MKINKNILIFYWLPVILWAGVIFTFSAFPATRTSEIHWQDFIVKKSAHVIVYFILSVFLYRAFVSSGFKKINAGYISILIAMFYGVSDEFHQSFTPGREPHIRDVIFDTIGATLAIYVIWKILPRAPKKLRKLAESLQLI